MRGAPVIRFSTIISLPTALHFTRLTSFHPPCLPSSPVQDMVQAEKNSAITNALAPNNRYLEIVRPQTILSPPQQIIYAAKLVPEAVRTFTCQSGAQVLATCFSTSPRNHVVRNVSYESVWHKSSIWPRSIATRMEYLGAFRLAKHFSMHDKPTSLSIRKHGISLHCYDYVVED